MGKMNQRREAKKRVKSVKIKEAKKRIKKQVKKEVPKPIKKRITKKQLILLGIFVGIVVIALTFKGGIIGNFLAADEKVSVKSSPPVDINYDNLESMFSKNSIVRDLPEERIVLLIFYTPDSGEMKVEKSYILTKGKVEEGTSENPDIIFSIPSKYLDAMNNKNFCSVIQSARENQELSIRTDISSVKLLWYFKGILKHRKCLGF